MVYTLNLPTYLPKAEMVMLVDMNKLENESVLGSILWSDFERILGDILLRLPDYAPIRYHLTGSLKNQQVADLMLCIDKNHA